MNTEVCKNGFLKFIRTEKRYSPHTLLAYSNDLQQFFQYITDKYQIQDLTQVEHTIIRSWLSLMREEGISARSINRKISTLKIFYKYLLRQSIITFNPMSKVMTPKMSKKLPEFIEEEKINTIFDTITYTGDFAGKRNKLILHLFYATGMRLSELINIQLADIDIPAGQLKVLGKRNKDRIIPFGIELQQTLSEYITLKPDTPNNYLLIDDKGKKLYPRFVYRIVNAYLSQVTTAKKKSPHVLRHTFATHMLNNGADLNAVKELLGHANLSATQVYTHNTVERLKNIHKQAHPKGE